MILKSGNAPGASPWYGQKFHTATRPNQSKRKFHRGNRVACQILSTHSSSSIACSNSWYGQKFHTSKSIERKFHRGNRVACQVLSTHSSSSYRSYYCRIIIIACSNSWYGQKFHTSKSIERKFHRGNHLIILLVTLLLGLGRWATWR